MHDFDGPRVELWREAQDRDRSFRLGGETFTYRVAVAPEALLPWLTMDADMGEAAALEAADQTVLNFLEPGQEDKWRKVRDPLLEPPVTQRNLLDLCKWLMEQQVGRPTGSPSVSSPESATEGPGTTSTAKSGSPVLQEA